MVKKITLHAIGNDGNFNYYIFDKKQEVMEILARFFNEIFDAYWELEETYTSKKNKPKLKKINIEKYKDKHWGERCKSDTRIDVYFGDKKMFVTIHCPEKLRLKFNESLGALVKIPKPRKIKTIEKKK